MRRLLTTVLTATLSLALLAGGVTTASAYVPDHWGSVKGHIRSFGYNPIASAEVYVRDATGNDDEPWIATTSKTGRFEIDLPAGQYRLTAFDSGTRYAPSAKPTFFTVTSKTATRVNKRLHNGAQVSGRIYDATGKPLKGVDVQAHGEAIDEPGYSADFDSSDTTGAFYIGQLNPGTYYILYRDPRSKNPRWIPGWYSDDTASSSPTPDGAIPVPVAAGKKTTGISGSIAVTP